MPMSEDELKAVIKSQLGNTIKFADDKFQAVNLDLLRRYNLEDYGNEEEGRSQVQSSDVFDTVESDMPPLTRIFLGANKVMEFRPSENATEREVDEANQKTAYADFLVRQQRESFKNVIGWMKEAGFAQGSIVWFYPEEIEKPEYVMYEGLTELELQRTLQSLEGGKKVDRVEVESQDENEGRFDVRFKVVKKTKKISISHIPSEQFVITRGCSEKDLAPMVGHVSRKTKGDLVAEGHDKDFVKKLPISGDSDNETKRERFKDQGGFDLETGYHWTNDEVEVKTLYPLVDFDEDGIPERRYVLKIGDEIVENEPFGIVPYAILSQILMPHQAIGKSRGQQASRYQLEKTAVRRGMMDNMYSVQYPRIAVDDSAGSIDGGKVDLDDLLSHQFEGVVRVEGDPNTALRELTTRFIGTEALSIMQYLDTARSQALGVQLANQGLDTDQLYKETATRFEGVEEANFAKIELVARSFAETGFRDLYEGVIWMAQHYQDDPVEIRVLGEPLAVNPAEWQFEHYCFSSVGLGAGDSAEMLGNLSGVLSILEQLIGRGSILADDQKIYNVLDDMLGIMGKPDATRYFNNPDVPESTLFAQNQILQAIVGQLQQQPNPLVQVEAIKQQGQLAREQAGNVVDMRKFILEMAQKDRHFAAELAKDLTKIDLDHPENVPGSLV